VWITFVDKKTAHSLNISITFRSKAEKNRKKPKKTQHPILPKPPSRKKILPILPRACPVGTVLGFGLKNFWAGGFDFGVQRVKLGWMAPSERAGL